MGRKGCSSYSEGLITGGVDIVKDRPSTVEKNRKVKLKQMKEQLESLGSLARWGIIPIFLHLGIWFNAEECVGVS